MSVNVVFCCDRAVLAGLFCAAFSVVEKASVKVAFTIFSNELRDEDMHLLRKCIATIGKPFSIERRFLDTKSLIGLRKLNSSYAAYFRILAAESMEVEKFVYLDVDTICGLDIRLLSDTSLDESPIAWVSESPLSGCVDERVACELRNTSETYYFNSGVLLIDPLQWKRQGISQSAMQYIADRDPDFHDQSALNIAVAGKAKALDRRFNRLCNQRQNWPYFVQGYDSMECIAHAVDYPKPWSPYARLVHPQYGLWREVKNRIVSSGFTEIRRWFPVGGTVNWAQRSGYQKAAKDRILFSLYKQGWLRQVKGIETSDLLS